MKKAMLVLFFTWVGCESEPPPPTGDGGEVGGSLGQGGTTGTGGGGRSPGGNSFGGAGAGGITTKCSTAADCVLIDDCCNCVAARRGTPPPVACPVACDVDMCTNAGVDLSQVNVGCWQGFCVPLAEPGNCNAAEVACPWPAPRCPTGYDYPSVINGCWGPCVANGSCVSTD